MPAESPVSSDAALETQIAWERYKAPIVAALIIALLAAAAYGGYYYYNDRRESQAAALLATAKAPPDYQKVIEAYGSTGASATAHLLLADSQRGEGKFADANATLQAFIAKFPKHELITTAWMAVAANLDSMGKPDEALTTYQRLAANYPQSFNAPLALLAQAQLLKQKNQIEQARQICETVLTQYRDSAISGEASRLLRVMKPKTEAAAPAPSAAPSAPPEASASSVTAPSAHP